MPKGSIGHVAPQERCCVVFFVGNPAGWSVEPPEPGLLLLFHEDCPNAWGVSVPVKDTQMLDFSFVTSYVNGE